MEFRVEDAEGRVIEEGTRVTDSDGDGTVIRITEPEEIPPQVAVEFNDELGGEDTYSTRSSWGSDTFICDDVTVL